MSKLKQTIAGLVLGIMIATPFLLAIEVPDQGSQLTTPYGRWKTVANLPAAGTEPAALDDDERTFKLVVAKILADVSGDGKIQVTVFDYGINTGRFRLIGDTEEGNIVTYVYSGAKDDYPDCDLVLRGILTFTIGTQVTIEPDMEFADTLVVTGDEASTKAWVTVTPENNTCAEGFIDFQGDDVVVTVGTTVTCDAKLIMKDF